MKHAALQSLVLASMAGLLSVGCTTQTLNRARQEYFNGQYAKAAETLDAKDPPERDKVLFQMERGMIRQAAGDYENSSRDLIDAYDRIDQMTAISVTRDTGSMIVNDNVQKFDGAPFERTMLHVFTAKNHLMGSNWDNAGVEARRIIKSLDPEVRKDYPEDAYSRYMAGFCLGLMGDWSNAGLQYRLAQKLAPAVRIDDRTGFIRPAPASTNEADKVEFPAATANELVVFVLIGRSPTGEQLLNRHRSILPAGYADVMVDGQVVGRSYELADTMDLAFTTKEKDAIKEVAKTVTRVAMKEATAQSLEQDNPLLGAMFRVIMIGILEQPDIRRWETLPRSLQVARIPLNGPPSNVDIHFKTSNGVTTRTVHVGTPTVHRGGTYIVIVRDSQLVL